MNKVLFLDIDGVLNCCDGVYLNQKTGDWSDEELQEPILYEKTTESWRDCSVYKYELLPSRLKLLKRIIEETDCKLVLSSTWREIFSLEEMLNIFRLVVPDFPNSFIGQTPQSFNYRPRGIEVSLYLEQHPEITKFSIVDDLDEFDNPKLKEVFVRTDSQVGLIESDAEKIIEILNGV